MRVIFFILSRVLLLLTVAPSDFICLKLPVLIIKLEGSTNSGTLHQVSPVSTWTVVLHINALDSAKLSYTAFICWVRAKTFSFGTLEILSLGIFLMNSCKEVMKKLLMLNILSNAIFRYVILLCSSSYKVLYFFSIILIKLGGELIKN